MDKKKTPDQQLAGTRRQAIRIARALHWDTKAIDAMCSLIERMKEISQPPRLERLTKKR